MEIPTASLTGRRFTSQTQGDIEESKPAVARDEIVGREKENAAGSGCSARLTEITPNLSQEETQFELFDAAWRVSRRRAEETENIGYRRWYGV